MKEYWENRMYLRGTSCLGIVNTILGTLFNRVIVLIVNDISDEIEDWRIDKGTDWPPNKEI